MVIHITRSFELNRDNMHINQLYVSIIFNLLVINLFSKAIKNNYILL
jgi:hypothetical protein